MVSGPTGWRWVARGVGDFAFGIILGAILIVAWWVGLAGVWLLLQRSDFPPLVVLGLLAYIAVTGPAWFWVERRFL